MCAVILRPAWLVLGRVRPLALGALALASLIAGCGGETKPAAAPPETAATAPPVPTTPSGPVTDAQVRRALHLPERVPLRATGDAPAQDVRVVRSWLDELSRGEVARAAKLFAIPARFQNFTSVAVIRTPRQALAVTDSLPCGAKLTKAGGASGFVVYEARLADRPGGGGCGAGVGGVVRGAVLVRDGHMVEWYRLPDRSSPKRGKAVIPDGPIV